MKKLKLLLVALLFLWLTGYAAAQTDETAEYTDGTYSESGMTAVPIEREQGRADSGRIDDAESDSDEDELLGSGLPALKENSVKDAALRSQFRRCFEGGVTAIADSAATGSFFAAGNDGFISRYTYGDLAPETWQVSDLPVKLLAAHPKKAHIAVYETDGFSIHKISLWDWQRKKQVYVKRFTDSVLSLSWSAQGTYLFIGTASAAGITVLDSKGGIKNVYPRPPGIVLLAATGPTEKSIVTYGEAGRLVYADIRKKSILTQYETEDRLENPELIKNYTHIIGYKNGAVMVIKAVSGEVAQTYPARSALFAGTMSDTEPVWIEKGENARQWRLCHGSQKSPVFTVPKNARITAARHTDDSIIIGTDDGSLYRLQQGADLSVSLTEVNPDTAIPIRDICINGDEVYALTGQGLFLTRSPEEASQLLYGTAAADRCAVYGNGFLLWSDRKAAPLYYAEAGKEPVIIYRPKEALVSVSVYEDTIAVVHAFSGLSLLDGRTGKRLFSYQAAGLQEAVQIDDRFVVIAKSSGDSMRKPLFLINIKTGETIPLNLDGDFAFSVQMHGIMRYPLSCLTLTTEQPAQTSVILMDIDTRQPSQSSFHTAFTYDDEDLKAFVYDDDDAVVTNLGKGPLIYYDKNGKQVRMMARDYVLPRKAVMTSDYIVSLNYDGSLSWFHRETLKIFHHHRLGD